MRSHAVILTAILGFGAPGVGSAQQAKQPTFRTSVDRVMVAATVRDQRGRPVTTLKAEDFELFDNGKVQKILDFQREPAPSVWRFWLITAAVWTWRRSARPHATWSAS